MKRLTAVLLSIVSPACTPPPPLTCQAFELPAAAIAQVGERVQTEVGLNSLCFPLPTDATRLLVADQAIVEVFDPNGEAFPFTAEKPVRLLQSNTVTNSVQVVFTPNRAGVWRITARLEPAIGSTTQMLPVVDVQDGSRARIVSAGALPTECRRYAQTASGTVLCGPSASNEFVTQRGQRFPASAVSVMGDTLWVKRTDTAELLERWVDDAGTFVKTHEAAIKMVQQPALMVAAPDESLWLLSSYEFGSSVPPMVQHIFPADDAGLRAVDVARFEVSGPAAIAAGNDTVQVCGAIGHAEYGEVDGGRLTQLPQIGRISMGGDETTLWTTNSQNLEALRPTAAGLQRAALKVPATSLGFFSGPPQLSPVLPMVVNPGSSWGAVPQLVDGKIVFTGYRTDAGFQLVGATKRHVYARSNDGKQLQVIDR